MDKIKTFMQERSRKQLVAMAIALVLLLVAALGGIYAGWLNNRVDKNIKREALLPEAGASTSTTSTQSPSPTYKSKTFKAATPSPANSSVKPLSSNLSETKPAPGTVGTGNPANGKNNSPGGVNKPKVRPLTDWEQEHAPPAPIPATGPEDAQPRGRLASQGNSMNYLIIGSDHRGNERGRSDVIIVAHTTGDKKNVHLVHFPRDYYTRIPGKGYEKINAAYSLGGAPLLVKTIQPLLGVPIDHVAILDFDGFKRMTDAVGGVDIVVPQNAGGAGYVAGRRYHMNGEQALAFVRERKKLAQGDISRGKRQMAFVNALLSKGVSPEVLLNPAKFTSFLDAGTRNVTVDNKLSMGEIRGTAWSLKDVRSNNVHSWTGPWRGTGTAANGRSVVWPAKKQLKVLSSALQRDAMNTYSDTVSPRRNFSR